MIFIIMLKQYMKIVNYFHKKLNIQTQKIFLLFLNISVESEKKVNCLQTNFFWI